jgi:5-hydroxyisourate hydrolase
MSAGGISTHVLDTARGRPAPGVVVILEVAEPGGAWREVGRGVTDADGRVAALLPGGPPDAGDYRLRFATGDYFRASGGPVFYPEVVVRARLEAGGKYHLPLLLSPYGYSTYRGS